jgi:hypothetical protein
LPYRNGKFNKNIKKTDESLEILALAHISHMQIHTDKKFRTTVLFLRLEAFTVGTTEMTVFCFITLGRIISLIPTF